LIFSVGFYWKRLTPATTFSIQAVDYDHCDGRETNIGKSFSRSPQIRKRRPRRTTVSADDQRRLLEAFIHAAQKGDLAALEGLLAEDVVSYSDGGGIVRTAARVPVTGRERVAKFIAAFASHFWMGMELTWVETNGQASVLLSRYGVPAALATIDASTQGIDRIMWVMRPSKLTAISLR
jgi:hypothetical protein